ncbi:hypothetical protein, partial [Pseudomonas sp. MPR-R1B]|uniref:hypothetical protein n=1 Tax=Pseudomonas sp. MPR-R1B TaxID=2070678 RepID=UPI001C476A17
PRRQLPRGANPVRQELSSMYRTIAAVMVAASLAGAAGAQTTTPPGIPAATTSSQSADAFSLENGVST